MKIMKDLLFDSSNKQVEFRPTPNKGGKYTPQYLVMHYTAATESKGSVGWFMNKEAKASAHLIIDRDGSITQFAPFTTVTWHAGISEWNGLIGLNRHAIGIELVNGGRVVKSGTNWICPVDKKVVQDSDVIVARHKNESSLDGWQVYTEIQLQTAVDVATLLVKIYNLKDVLGHEDIAPHRKSDPGPAFPMGSFRSKVMGRKEDIAEVHITKATANIRGGAGTHFLPVISEMLPPNTEVHVLKREGNWSFVEVIDTVHGVNDLEGWIFTKLLVTK